MQPDPSKYKVVSIWPNFKTEVGGNLVVTDKGIIIEVTKGPHHILTQGSSGKISKGYYDFSSKKLLLSDNSLREVIMESLEHLKTTPSCEFPSSNGFIKGYFEFLRSSKRRFSFIDFNTTTIMNNITLIETDIIEKLTE